MQQFENTPKSKQKMSLKKFNQQYNSKLSQFLSKKQDSVNRLIDEEKKVLTTPRINSRSSLILK